MLDGWVVRADFAVDRMRAWDAGDGRAGAPERARQVSDNS